MTELPAGVTERDAEELAQLAAFLDESAAEIVAADVPAVVEAAIIARVDSLLPNLAARFGTDQATTTIATMAYLAGRKAERAGLLHESRL
jgi:hypothetical protein